jgi:hypothetical protein
MKRIFYYILGITFLAVCLASCGKTTKGKITNEWRVVSYSEQTTNGDTINSYSTGDASNNSNNLTIDKDGTWTWKTASSHSGYVFGGTVFLTDKESTTQSGTWSFIGKTKGDDFKKNERVLFTVLSESSLKSETGGGGNPVFPDTTVSSSQTYLTGEKVLIYTVVKSTHKELQLESESSHTNSSTGETSSKKVKVLLEAKK